MDSPSDILTLAFGASVLYLLYQLRSFRKFLGAAGFRIELGIKVLRRLHHLPKRRRWFLDQLFTSGIMNVHVVLLVGLFVGMILSLQMGIELARYGQQDQIGVIVAASMAREMGPFITAVILAATVGSALAAEIGTMSVADELSALEVLSVDRVSFLVLPRVVALAIIAPFLTVLCNTIGILGGGFVAGSQLHVGWGLYMDSAIQALRTTGEVIQLPKDVFAGLFKASVFGGIVAIISCSCGLKAKGGALEIGRASCRERV